MSGRIASGRVPWNSSLKCFRKELSFPQGVQVCSLSVSEPEGEVGGEGGSEDGLQLEGRMRLPLLGRAEREATLSSPWELPVITRGAF